MDKTKEKLFNIDELKELLNTVNYSDIMLADTDDWTTEQAEAMDTLLQYTDSKPKFDYANQEEAQRLYESIDGYMYEIISKIPIEQRADFYRSINPNNTALFFTDTLIQETPELYSIFMSNFFGKEEYKEIFSYDSLEDFDFLQDCSKLIEQLDSFPTASRIDVSIYKAFISKLAENVYSKLPDDNKGKAVLSYLRNTDYKSSEYFINLRGNFIESVLPKDYVFGNQDYEAILNDLDVIIDNQAIDNFFFDTVLNHSTDEFKTQFTNHIIDKALSIIKENGDDNIINFFDSVLGKSIEKVNFSKFENTDKIINFFINNNMGKAINMSFATSKPEDIVKYFEDFISREEDVKASKNGIIKAFVGNLDFKTYDISSNNITAVADYILTHCDKDSLKVLLDRGPKKYKQPIIDYMLKYHKDIPNNGSWLNGKADFLTEAAKASEPNAIKDTYALNVLYYALGFSTDFNRKFFDRAEEMIINFSKVDYQRKKLVSTLLSKIENKDALNTFKTFVYTPYEITEDDHYFSRTFSRTEYGTYLGEWLNQLSPNLIEEFICKSHYIKDKFIQDALNKPEKYSNIVSAIDSMRAKTVLPDMHEIDERIEKGDVLNLEEMEDFSKKIDLIRLKNGIIPEKYCDFAIRNTILAKGQEYDIESDYFRMYPLCIVDKTRYVLKSEGIEDVTVFANNKELSNFGLYSDSSKELVLSATIINGMSKGIYNIINTIFHETQHAVQNRDINNNTIQNISEYDMIKEQLLREDNFLFYDSNYKSITAEIEARVVGRQKMYQYLQSLGISVEQILQGDCEYNKDIRKTYEEYVREEADKLDNPNKKFKISFSDTKSLDCIFDELMAKNPKLIEDNPLLKYEYNDDGTRKSSLEMLQEYEDTISNPGYVEPQFVLQEYLMTRKYNGNPDIQKDIMLRDAELLNTFMPKTEKGKNLLNNIIARMEIYSNELYTQRQMINQSGDINKAREMQDESIKITSAISSYFDRKMMQEFMDMTNIDEMVSDEQRAEALSQIQGELSVMKQQNRQTQQVSNIKEQVQNVNSSNPSKDDGIEL